MLPSSSTNLAIALGGRVVDGAGEVCPIGTVAVHALVSSSSILAWPPLAGSISSASLA